MHKCEGFIILILGISLIFFSIFGLIMSERNEHNFKMEAIKNGYVQKVDKDSYKVIWVKGDCK